MSEGIYCRPCFSELLGKPARALTKASVREAFVISRPDGIGAFKFAVLASLRAAQLCRGCSPRIEGAHSVAVTAQMEVAGGTVAADETSKVVGIDQSVQSSPVAAMSV